VNGPLRLIKQSWLSDDVLLSGVEKTNLVDFVLELRERIRVSVRLGNENAVVAKSKSKEWYDRCAKVVDFEVGQQVLLFLPLIGKPLEAKYAGPYVVLDKLGPVDYLVATPDRRKSKRVVHVNLMRKYESRIDCVPPLDVGLVVPACVNVSAAPKLEEVVADSPLDCVQRVELLELLGTFEGVFSDVPGKTTLISHRIDLVPGARPVRQSAYRLHPERMAQVDKEIQGLIAEGIVEESESAWASPIVLVPKSDGSLRLCTDFRKLNALTVADPFPMPRVESLIDKVGKAKFLTKLDATRGFWQVPINSQSIPLTGFVTPHGHYQWRYLAFGLRNAPATFSRLIAKMLRGLDEFCDGYLDDLMVFSYSWIDHLSHLKRVLTRISDAKLTLNLKKCVFANAELDFLGHHIGLNSIQPRTQKVEALLGFPRPVNKKQVQSFLGLAGYYRKFLPHYSQLVLPLTELLKKGHRFAWSSVAENAFVDLKSRMASRPILKPPDFDKPFYLAVDASYFCLGGCLFQITDEVEHPICYMSRKLSAAEVRYSTIEKEALALVVGVRAFSVYFGSAPVVVYTDHSPLQFINRMANSNAKLLRWSLELQQYSLRIIHRKGVDNTLPDILSRPSV
jgi:serine protease inhibitor ecotin